MRDRVSKLNQRDRARQKQSTQRMKKLTKRNYRTLLTKAKSGDKFLVDSSLNDSEIEQIDSRVTLTIQEDRKCGVIVGFDRIATVRKVSL